MEYIKGRTERKPRQNWECSKEQCKNDCGSPLDEYYHCLVYIERKIREDYVRIKKGYSYTVRKQIPHISLDDIDEKGDISIDGTLIGTVRTKNNDYSNKECNGCRFKPADSSDFDMFMNICRTHDEINNLFDMWVPELKGWMCEAFEISDVDISDKTHFRNYDRVKYDMDFWKKRLCR